VTLPPIRREVLVNVSAAVAYDLFTTEIGEWWPLGDFGVFGAEATVAFEDDGRIVERSPDGASQCWGEVTAWEPPGLLAFTWHPGSDSALGDVTVTFSDEDGPEVQTRVVLEHRGWEQYGDPAAARAGYGEGWPVVLSRFRTHAARSGEVDPGEVTWVALMHRPGPEVPDEETVFGQPLFHEHVAFLERMRAAGYLVAAGPLEGRSGEGMAILRLPGAGQLDEATRLATEDDLSVAKGLFTVTVRPWRVLLTA
jgi:uncharacterized protein YndB with AHSA1/START domain/uncharacterized protein YciI